MKKLLIAEDDQFLNKAYQNKLTSAGYEVKIVTDGDAVLPALSDFTPDLILLDLIMPKKDGFMVLKELKASSTTKHIPVIITTNLGEKENRDMCVKLGAIDYFVKTDISLAELVGKLKKILR